MSSIFCPQSGFRNLRGFVSYGGMYSGSEYVQALQDVLYLRHYLGQAWDWYIYMDSRYQHVASCQLEVFDLTVPARAVSCMWLHGLTVRAS